MGETWCASTAFGLVWKVGYCKCICFNVYLQSGTTIVVMCFFDQYCTWHLQNGMKEKKISIFYLPVLDERTYSSLWSSKIYWQQVRDSQESHVRPMFGAHRVIRILLFLLRSVVSLAGSVSWCFGVSYIQWQGSRLLKPFAFIYASYFLFRLLLFFFLNEATVEL